MAKRRLNDEQRQQLYNVTREEFNACKGIFPSHHVRKAVKKRLVGFGWEQILINLAIQVAIALVKRWIENWEKNAEFEPPAAMPLGFASEEIDG